MNALGAALRELAGLFVEDGSLVAEILTVVLLAALSATLIPQVPLATGGILLLGCLGVFFANVARAAGRR
jgi:hypothetical protein